jgi:hypothetical protein
MLFLANKIKGRSLKMTQKHIIKKQILDLTLDAAVGSFTFQSEVGTLFKQEIVPLIDEYCGAIDTGAGVIRIDQLEVDLGRIAKSNFGRDFQRKVAQLLPQKITEAVQMSLNCERSGAKTRWGYFSEADRNFAVLEFFINEGCLPWWVSTDESYEMPVLLQQNIAVRPEQVKALIVKIAGNGAMVKRLTDHADDAILGRIAALFQPGHVQAISQLAQIMLSGLTDCALLKSCGAAKLRAEVWGSILAQSAVTEGQAFNRQLAFETTVKQLVKVAGVDEEDLVNQLAKAGADIVALQTPMAAPVKPSVTGVTLNNEAYRRQLETVARLLKTFPIVLLDEVLAPQIAEFESGLAELGLASDAAVDDKISKADQKSIKKISKALMAIKQLNQRQAASQAASANAKGPVRSAKQLATVAKLLIQLSKGSLFKEVAGNLAQLLRTVQNAAQLVEGLLNGSGTGGLSATAPAARLVKQVEEFETTLRRFSEELTAVAAHNNRAAQNGLFQDLKRSIATIEALSVKSAPRDESLTPDSFSAASEIYVNNAGLVLLWPYLSRFFGALGLVDANRFVTEAAAGRAVLLLHYLATGTTKVFEYELPLNKIMCGIAVSDPVKPDWEVTEAEQAECESLLQAVIRNWPALKNGSLPGLRSLFLRREGLIFTRDGQRVLRIAGTAYDILVNQIPWGIGTVKLPWMEQLLMVEWGV